jgi:SAM-dependent methyltransferase
MSGRCTGIDISEPMIACARALAEREDSTADFICADAQVYAFEPAGFDMIVSRVGVMFFDDSVSAFANLRRAASDDAELQFVVSRSAAENPFMTTAERAAAPLLPDSPAREAADAPGRLSFANPDHVRRILEESGWAEIEIRPIDVPCKLPERELIGYFTRLSPLAAVLHEVDGPTRTKIVETVRAAFEPFVHGDEVRFDSACWRVSARST